MGLRKKTFLYSVTLAVIMIVFVIGYFVFMLPSLYVDYVMNSNLESVIEIQKGYMEERSYDNLTVKNPSSVFTMVCHIQWRYRMQGMKFILRGSSLS